MNKRIIKKQNKSFIKSILKQLPFTVSRAIFGNGYFLYKFDPNSICWFWLKEFPEYKFGIWLNICDNKLSIFGEHVLSIDKFKPSATTISETTVENFVKELNFLKNEDESYKEYLEEIEEYKLFPTLCSKLTRICNIFSL